MRVPRDFLFPRNASLPQARKSLNMFERLSFAQLFAWQSKSLAHKVLHFRATFICTRCLAASDPEVPRHGHHAVCTARVI